jgi:hypothetical protein
MAMELVFESHSANYAFCQHGTHDDDPNERESLALATEIVLHKFCPVMFVRPRSPSGESERIDRTITTRSGI